MARGHPLRHNPFSSKRRYVATPSGEVRSTGSVNQFIEANPYRRPICPPRRTPIPTVHGMETATVVGPSGEEIHTDEHGRIKVQFHWDRLPDDKENKERSSCWIRVAQMWGGPGWVGTALDEAMMMDTTITEGVFDDIVWRNGMLTASSCDGASFRNADLSGTEMIGCTFIGANLEGAQLRGVNAKGCVFRKAVLTGVDFTGSM